jgi:hypothetical protein
MPVSGSVFARMESRPILRGVRRGGFVDVSECRKTSSPSFVEAADARAT